MLRKTITLTEQQDSWVKSQVEQGNFGNDSEYIRSVLRQEMLRHQAEQEMRDLIEKAEESGFSVKSPMQIWDDAVKGLE